MTILRDEDLAAHQQYLDTNFRAITTNRSLEQDLHEQELEEEEDIYKSVRIESKELEANQIKDDTTSGMSAVYPNQPKVEGPIDPLDEPDEEEDLYTITGAQGIHSAWLSGSPALRAKEARHTYHERMKLSSYDYQLRLDWQEALSETRGYLSKDQANALVKKYGADITFDKDTTAVKVAQAIDTYRRKQALDYYTYQLESSGSLSVAQRIGVLASSLAGAVGPVELVGTVATSVLAPEAVVAGIAKTAGTLRSVLFAGKAYKTMQEAASITNRLKYANTVAKGAAGMNTADDAARIANLHTKGLNRAAQRELEEKNLELLKKLEDLENLGKNFDALSRPAKAGVDAATFMATDVPFIGATYYGAGELGQRDLYTAKDVAADFLLAGSLGVGVPALFRQVFNVTPKAYIYRRIDQVERNIYENEALGNISKEEATRQHKVLNDLRENIEKSEESYNKQHPHIQEMAEGLRQSNLTDTEFKAQVKIIYNNLVNGIRPKLSEIPFASSLISSISLNTIKRLRKPYITISSLFGQNLQITAEKMGLVSGKVIGERGLLGRYTLMGITADEITEQMGNVYKGFVLRNKKALRAYREWTESIDSFLRSLEQLRLDIKKQQDHNTRVRAELKARKKSKDKIIPVQDQINVRRALEEAWMRHYLRNNDEALAKYLQESTNFYENKLNPETRVMTKESQAFMESFEKFYNEYVVETKIKGYTAYDFAKNVKEGADKVKAEVSEDYKIHKFMMALEAASEENKALGNIDNYLKELSQEKVDDIVRAVSEYDTTADTDLNNLFGLQRRTSEEWETAQKNSDMYDLQVAVKQMEYDGLFSTPEGKALRSILISSTDADKESKSSLNKSMLLIETVKKFKEGGIPEMQKVLLNAIHSDENFQKSLVKSFEAGTIGKGFALNMRAYFSKVMKELNVERVIDDQELSKIVTKLVDRVIAVGKENMENLNVLLSPPELAKRMLGTTGETLTDSQKAEVYTIAKLNMDNLFRPVFTELNIQLDRLQLQAMHDVTLYKNILELMIQNPANATEVLTGRATQTVYNFFGSKRNVEYMTKTSGAYIADLKNRLRTQTAQTVSGRTLLEIFNDPDYAGDIADSIIAIKHGQAGTKNADADRVAQMILDQEASFLGGFLKFGSEYSSPKNLIRRSKLRFMDGYITDTSLQDILGTIKASLAKITPNLLAGPGITEGTVKYGSEVLSRKDVKVNNILKKIAKEKDTLLDDIFKIHNPIYKKLAVFALRDLDLDRMFDPNGTALVGFNVIRDALFSGDWSKAVQGDLGNFRNIIVDLKRLKTILVGKDLIQVQIGDELLSNPASSSWVFKFTTGLEDTGAITKETKAAYVNAYEGNMHFKDYQSELSAVKAFGYESIADYVEQSFARMHQAYFCLELFGTRPVALATDLMTAYEKARKAGNPVFEKAIANYVQSRGSANDIASKLGISQNQFEAVVSMVAQTCGVQNNSPSSATRFVKSIVRLISSPMLIAAGWKSLGDYGTIWAGLQINALAEGRLAAAKLTSDAVSLIAQNRDLLDLVLATHIIESEDLLKKMHNDPTADLVSLSSQAGMADKLEGLSNWWADAMLNGLGRMSQLTNSNKRVAGMAIEMAIGKNADLAYSEMSSDLKKMLFRESIDEKDWEFIRKHLIHNVADYVNTKLPEGSTKFKGRSFNLLIPNSALDLSDEVVAQELKSRGVKYQTKNMLDDFRRDLLNKTYNLVDTSAEEMCSIPSNRVGNVLRGGRPRGSGWGTGAEIITQYMSFGASILYNTYGRYLANVLDGEVGITILDLFNPHVKLAKHSRPEIFMGLFGHIMTVATTMMVVESAVKASQGNIQRPYDEYGLHLDNILISPMLGSLGLLGTILDAVWTGVEGSGQRGGGFAIQAAPSVSNVLRQTYRVRQPLVSTRIHDEDRPQAVGAAVAQNVAGQVGVKSAPVIGPVYQVLIGDWLDMKVKGGRDPYRTYLNNMERRGQVIPEYRRDPKPFWDRLPYNAE